MNKYISKAMIYKNLGIISSLSILIFGSLSLNILEYFNNPATNYHVFSKIDFFFTIFLLIACSSEIYNKKEVTYSYLLTTPIKKETIIITNLIIPIISFATAILLYFIISIAILFFDGYLWQGIGLLCYKLMLLFSLLLLVNSFIQIFQLLINNHIAGALLPLIYLLILIPLLFIVFLNSLNTIFPALKNFNLIIFLINLSPSFMRSFGYVKYSASIYDYNINWVNGATPIIAFILLALIFSIIAILINKKIKTENLSKFFSFKWFEKIFIILSSIFISLIILSLVMHKVFNAQFIDIASISTLLIVYTVAALLIFIVYKLFYMLWKKAAL